MTTIEIQNPSLDNREDLRDMGFSLEDLGVDKGIHYYDIEVDDADSDALTDKLDAMGIEWRIV